MAIGAFTDKQHPPARREIARMLGAVDRRLDDFKRFVEENFRVDGEWKYYGKNYGWALRYKKRGKALVSLYPAKESFTAQLILSPSVVQRSRDLKLGKATRSKIDRAHPYPEGRWVFLEIDSSAKVEDAKKLLLLKMSGGTKSAH